MLDESYPLDAVECSDDSDWNYILDFFDVISYQDPIDSAKNQRPAKTRGDTMREKFLKRVLHSGHYKY